MTLDFTADESEVALRQILEHPQARTLRKLSLGGEARVLARYLDLLTGTREVFPWLRALELRRFDMAWQPAIDGITAKRLIAMTPALEDLSLRGHYVLGTFSHPNLRRLALDNYFAGRHMRDADHVLPALTEARLGLGPGPWSENELFLLFSAKRTPALRHLDISAPPRHSLMALLAGLGQMSARRQLTHLYLPAFVTVYEVARLDVTIRSMEDLIEIHVPAELPAPIGHPAQVIVGAGRAGP
jgi:hypothetical protein